LQESQDAIREAAAAQGFIRHHTATVDASTDWPALFSLSQAMSLFSSRQTLLLILPEMALTRQLTNSSRRWSACCMTICC
jgi:DNA polymerase-3 subunit delta